MTTHKEAGSMNMIERIATIVERSLERHGVENYRGTLDDAKDILEAMREPTDHQRNVYYELSHRTDVFSDAVWERSIDAALKEE